ncbi:RICIN domain-containing protein [Lentzea sp. NPDC051213]|uniref:RICIN domain-containing protein n=1 Tax=Lentzea sp. NPDC051213 TaxID=3364126 RepID=UPI00379384CA
MGKLAAIFATAAAVTALTAVPASAEPVVVYQLAGSNRCLADIGTDVVLKPCNETSNEQRWIVPVSDADQPHNIATRKCLTATSTGQVRGQACTTGAAQRWRRLPNTPGPFQFRNIGTGKCLTAQVTVAACTSSSQRWNGLR